MRWLLGFLLVASVGFLSPAISIVADAVERKAGVRTASLVFALLFVVMYLVAYSGMWILINS